MQRMLLILLVVLAACTPAEETAETSSVAPTIAVESTTAQPSTTTPTTTITPTTPAPTVPVPTTAAPTTTSAPLDRSPDAAAVRITADVAALVAFGPRVEGSEAERTAGDWLVRRLSESSAVRVSDVALPQGLTSRNLELRFGDPTTGPWTLLGAHYDSVTGSPGADDNASGTAILMELAARLAEQPPPRGAVTLVLFGAEERFPGLSADDHHYGSRQWVAAQADGEGVLPDLMVSVDMVGVGDRLFAVAYRGTSAAAVDRLAAAADATGLELGRLERGDISDHEPFALAGVPAAMLWRPDNPDYHAAGDTAVDPSHVVDVLALIEALLDDVHS